MLEAFPLKPGRIQHCPQVTCALEVLAPAAMVMLRTVKGLRAYPTCSLARKPAVSWMLAEDTRLLCHTQSSLFFTAVAVAQVSTHFLHCFSESRFP